MAVVSGATIRCSVIPIKESAKMCYQISSSIVCSVCDDAKARVVRACVNKDGRAYDCGSYLCPQGDGDPSVIFVKCDKPTAVTYICGGCVLYITTGDAEFCKPMLSMEEVDSAFKNPVEMVDFMIDFAKTTPLDPAEDGCMCGYRNEQGKVTMILCAYELCGDTGSTIVYSEPRKRRLVD
jgi:hypothetical protein